MKTITNEDFAEIIRAASYLQYHKDIVFMLYPDGIPELDIFKFLSVENAPSEEDVHRMIEAGIDSSIKKMRAIGNKYTGE